MSEALPITGGCLCGAVRFEIDAAATSVGYCHCRMCQRNTGQPFAVGATFPSASLRLVKGESRAYRSSQAAHRHFCPDCGSPLFFAAVGAREIDVWIGALDEPARFRPTSHIWMSAAMPWLHIDDELPRYDERRDG